MDYLRAIETLSQSEEPVAKSVSEAGPGGEAYDRVPTPAGSQEQKGKLVRLADRAKQMVSDIAGKLPDSDQLARKTSQEAERLPRRAAVFFKHNAVMIGGIAAFAVSLLAARRYWQKHR